MSHILDALRRAEDERRLGKPPDRGMIAGPLRSNHPRANHRRWLSIIGALLLAVAAVLAYRELAPRHDGAPPASSTVSSTTPLPPIATAPPAPSLQTKQAPTPAPPAAPAELSSDAPELPRARLDEAGRIQNLDALFAEQEQTAPPTPTTVDNSSETSLEPRDVFQTPGEAPSETKIPASSASSEASDLPSTRSAGMPDFTIQVHAWAPEADERFIRVDGRRLVEGDSLPNGARIARIARDGVVLEWRGQRLMRRLGR